MRALRIGEAARELGLPTHVLRHWEEVGVLHPSRTPSGHRVYDEETLTRARMAQTAQRGGFTLAEIAGLGDLATPGRRLALESKRGELRHRIRDLERADALLAHTLECVHPMVSLCPQCRELSLPAT